MAGKQAYKKTVLKTCTNPSFYVSGLERLIVGSLQQNCIAPSSSLFVHEDARSFACSGWLSQERLPLCRQGNEKNFSMKKKTPTSLRGGNASKKRQEKSKPRPHLTFTRDIRSTSFFLLHLNNAGSLAKYMAKKRFYLFPTSNLIKR